MKTSLIIPFKNEVEYAAVTLKTAHAYLSGRGIIFELVVVDDSTDGTWEIIQSFVDSHQNIIAVKGGNPPGYGKALRKGFDSATGDILIPFNGDLSDALEDVISYIRLIEEDGYDMVFGSRFIAGAKITDAMAVKNFMSRWGNALIQIFFRTNCSDITNSFKAYRKEVLEDITPTADGFNVSMELTLKSIRRNYRYTTIPVIWSGRKYGDSKMQIIKSAPTYLSTAFKIMFH